MPMQVVASGARKKNTGTNSWPCKQISWELLGSTIQNIDLWFEVSVHNFFLNSFKIILGPAHALFCCCRHDEATGHHEKGWGTFKLSAALCSCFSSLPFLAVYTRFLNSYLRSNLSCCVSWPLLRPKSFCWPGKCRLQSQKGICLLPSSAWRWEWIGKCFSQKGERWQGMRARPGVHFQ